MEFLKFLSIFLFSVFLLFTNETHCNTFHPLSYANYHFFAIERKPAHELRNDIKNVMKNFLSVQVQNLLKKIPEIHLRSDGTVHPEYADSIKEQIETLLKSAENKRELASRIKQSYDKAIKEDAKRGNILQKNAKKSRMLKQNYEQIQNLVARALQLEEKAEQLKKYLKDLRKKSLHSKKMKCNISKIGTLRYVSSRNGLKHTIENVKAEIDQEGLTLYHQNEKKMVYLWNLIEVPFTVVGSVKQCFYFSYKNQQPMFCADSVIESHSWINALTEGFLCSNYDIKGTVVNREINVDAFKKNEDMISVEIHPEDDGTRVLVDNVEFKIKGSDEIDINKLKKSFDDERKIATSEENSESA